MALLVSPALAITIHVPLDQPTIQAGIDAAADGDTVELDTGTYTGPGNNGLDFTGKSLVLRSGSGDPAACVIDCQASEEASRRGLHLHSGESDAALEGISIVNGWVPFDPWDGGAAILCENESSLRIQNCFFTANHGSAIFSRNWSNVDLADCLFTDNEGRNGGAVSYLEGQHAIIRCRFMENSAESFGGALHGHAATFTFQDCQFTGNIAECGAAIDMIYSCTAFFERCLFEENVAVESFWSAIINLHGFVSGNFVECTFANNVTSTGGYVLVTSKMSHGILDGCTFWGNHVPNGDIVFFGEIDGRVDNTIIAGSTAGRPLYISRILSLSCCDIYGNADGDWVDSVAEYLGVDGNISEDPLFCDTAVGNFMLYDSSPCAPFSPPNPECDLIGAWPVGCIETPTAEASWGAIKNIYRP